MNNVIDIMQNDMSEAGPVDSTVPVDSAVPMLPFAFAKRNGVLVGAVTADNAVVLMRPGVSTTTLAEVRRFLRTPY